MSSVDIAMRTALSEQRRVLLKILTGDFETETVEYAIALNERALTNLNESETAWRKSGQTYRLVADHMPLPAAPAAAPTGDLP